MEEMEEMAGLSYMHVASIATFDTAHEDLIHDAQLDYYGKRLATCSSDRSIRIFEVDGDSQRLLQVLTSHEGPVWQVAWGHPKYGNVLASCSYDGKVFIWKETNGQFVKIKEHAAHTASVNSIAWAPHEFGLILAAASADGKISILSRQEDNNWETQTILAHSSGCNTVSWAPSAIPGSLIMVTGANASSVGPKRLASGGCDNLVKIWSEENGQWNEEAVLEGHSDWVRDVAWAPNMGLPNSELATCSQDKTVIIWTQENPATPWKMSPLKADGFSDVVWRVSWSTSGNILAVSTGDNSITMWKQNLEGGFQQISTLDDDAPQQ
ncbi:WD40-repeat-containing domain protein [Cladochytrium replicatum]|nr:WD40-repeat-containing domain protein [Cladochytrium replicatum]